MTKICRVENSRYSPRQIFDLVAEVEKYPEFLPWCSAARITTQESEHVFLAELVISFKALRERYTSRVSLTPPKNDNEKCSVNAVMIEGPFHHLTNHWELLPAENGGTEIHLELDFQFKSKMLEKLIGGLFEKASEKMISAFRERARNLYAASSTS